MDEHNSARTPTRIGWAIVLSIAMLAGFVYAYAHGMTWFAAHEWIWDTSGSWLSDSVKIVLLTLAVVNFMAVFPILFEEDEDIRSIIPHLLHDEIELWEVLLLLLLLPAAVFLAVMNVVHPLAKRFFKWLGHTAGRVLTTKVMKRK